MHESRHILHVLLKARMDQLHRCEWIALPHLRDMLEGFGGEGARGGQCESLATRTTLRIDT
jgi:hypothetical protein